MEKELLIRVLVVISVIGGVKIFNIFKNKFIKKDKEVDKKEVLKKEINKKFESTRIILGLLFILGLFIELFVPYLGFFVIAIALLCLIVLVVKESKKEY